MALETRQLDEAKRQAAKEWLKERFMEYPIRLGSLTFFYTPSHATDIRSALKREWGRLGREKFLDIPL